MIQHAMGLGSPRHVDDFEIQRMPRTDLDWIWGYRAWLLHAEELIYIYIYT